MIRREKGPKRLPKRMTNDEFGKIRGDFIVKRSVREGYD